MTETSRKPGAQQTRGTCAVTGAIHTPTMSPYLPITPDQIASEAIAAATRLRRLRSVDFAKARTGTGGGPKCQADERQEMIG